MCLILYQRHTSAYSSNVRRVWWKIMYAANRLVILDAFNLSIISVVCEQASSMYWAFKKRTQAFIRHSRKVCWRSRNVCWRSRNVCWRSRNICWRMPGMSNVDGMHATKEKSFLNVFETCPRRILDVLLWGVCYKHTRICSSSSRTILNKTCPKRVSNLFLAR